MPRPPQSWSASIYVWLPIPQYVTSIPSARFPLCHFVASGMPRSFAFAFPYFFFPPLFPNFPMPIINCQSVAAAICAQFKALVFHFFPIFLLLPPLPSIYSTGKQRPNATRSPTSLAPAGPHDNFKQFMRVHPSIHSFSHKSSVLYGRRHLPVVRPFIAPLFAHEFRAKFCP